jgi:hypothetical protein
MTLPDFGLAIYIANIVGLFNKEPHQGVPWVQRFSGVMQVG